MVDCNITANYFAEKRRMTKRCELGCSNCPLNKDKILSCIAFQMLYPEKAIATVQKWSDEHPQKTFLSEFLKNYPNAQLKTVLSYSQLDTGGIFGIPKCICPYHLGLMSSDDCREDNNCVKCWNQHVEKDEE